MRRRLWLTAVPGLVLGLGACSGSPFGGSPNYTVSADQLQQALGRRFPLRFPVAGLLDLNVLAPSIRLLPELNRVGSVMALEAVGPALRQPYTGTLDLDFGLRYEASDQSIRAHQPRVHSLRLSGLPARATELLQAYGPAVAQQALQDLVLHRLRPQDVAAASRMGLQPGPISVTAQGLLIGFVGALGR